MELPIRRRDVLYKVAIDPTLDLRGTTHLTREGIYEPARIVLREWDAEVLLHECLHALLHEGGFRQERPGEPTVNVWAEEESLVGHLSRGLFDMGWRLTPEKQSETTA